MRKLITQKQLNELLKIEAIKEKTNAIGNIIWTTDSIDATTEAEDNKICEIMGDFRYYEFDDDGFFLHSNRVEGYVDSQIEM